MQILRKIRVALTPRSGLLKTKLSNGLIVYGRNRTGYGGRGIYVLRESIEPEFEHLEALLGNEGVFVDVGASTGIYALKAAKHFGSASVVLALEPFPEVCALLQRNVQANRLSTVRVRCLCAGAHTGVRTLWLNDERPSYFSLAERRDDARGLSVLTVALDDLLPWEGLDRVDYLKIDVEGAEEEILAGARRTIQHCRPIIQAEINIRRFVARLPAYTVFQASASPNLVYIPDEHPKIEVPERLGWRRLKGSRAS